MTFSPKPHANLLWSVMASVLLSAGLFGGFLIGCGSGAPTPIQNGPNLMLNVRDFQAIGDGVTDDTSAFVSALAGLTANGGGTLVIPAGTYLVGDLKVGSGTSIMGIGVPLPVLAKTPTANSILDISPLALADSQGLHDITIENLSLRGRSIEDGFSEHVHNISVRGVTRLSIHNVQFEAFQGDGLQIGTRVLAQ